MYAVKDYSVYQMTSSLEEMNIDDMCRLLWSVHWASHRSKDVIIKSLKNSQCFGIMHGSRQIGMARVISDYATFAYISDVIIDDEYRGQQLGRWLLETILYHPDLVDIPQWRLKTTYAHDFYKQFGFKELKYPGKFLEILK